MNAKQRLKLIERYYRVIENLKAQRPDKWELGIKFAMKRINALNRG
jgi:hypothetical protein